MIKDAEMSFIAEGDSRDGGTGAAPVSAFRSRTPPESLRVALAVAESKASRFAEEREQAFEATKAAEKERDEARAGRDQAEISFQRERSERTKVLWEEVIRAGTQAIEEEESVRAMIRSFRKMLESVNM